MKFGGFKSQMILYPKQLLDMKKHQYGGYNPRWRLTKIEMLYNLSNNDTTMKFGGFKSQMMFYLIQPLDKNSTWRLQSNMAANSNQNCFKKF